MTRQLISINSQTLLRSPHAQRPPRGRLRSSPVLGGYEHLARRLLPSNSYPEVIPVQKSRSRKPGFDEGSLNFISSNAVHGQSPDRHSSRTGSVGSVAHRRTTKSVLLNVRVSPRSKESFSSIFWPRCLSVISRMCRQGTVAALRKALRLHAEGMVKTCAVVFPGKGCRQLY